MKGEDAEDAALRHLRGHGARLVDRNWRCPLGELDLVMEDGGTLAVVEVRHRTSEHHGSAAETVTQRKQQRIARATRAWLSAHRDRGRQPLRFDVVAVSGDGGCDWIRGAFEARDD